MNSCIFSGKIAHDPVLKVSQHGVKYVRLTLEIDDFNKDPYSNRLVNTCYFIDCVAYDDMAEALSKKAAKGQGIVIQSKLSIGYYHDDENRIRDKQLYRIFDYDLEEVNKEQKIKTWHSQSWF